MMTEFYCVLRLCSEFLEDSTIPNEWREERRSGSGLVKGESCRIKLHVILSVRVKEIWWPESGQNHIFLQTNHFTDGIAGIDAN